MRAISFMLTTMFIWSLGGGLANMQMIDRSEILKRPVRTTEKQLLSADEAFHASLVTTRAYGGMAIVTDCAKSRVKEWQPDGKSLEETLNDIVAANHNYRWELQNGSIDLLPTSGEPILLQTPIDKFHITTTSSLEALNYIMKQKTVQAAMQYLRLRSGLTIINYLSSSREFVIDFKGGSLRDALNTIAAANGTDIWQYKEIHCGDRHEVTIKF